MKRLLFVFAIAACGGNSQAPGGAASGPPAPPASQCDVTARHMTEAVFKWKEPPPTTQDNVFTVLQKHCNDDKWSAEAMTCFQQVTDEASSEPCAAKLTTDQLKNVMGAMYAKFDDTKKESAPAPTGSAPESADPCEGGE